MRSRLVQHLGEISYSVYLLHFAVACFMMKGLDALQDVGLLCLPIAMKSLVVAISTVTFTIPLAHLCYRYIEAPGIRLGKRFGREVRTQMDEGFSLLPETTPQPE